MTVEKAACRLRARQAMPRVRAPRGQGRPNLPRTSLHRLPVPFDQNLQPPRPPTANPPTSSRTTGRSPDDRPRSAATHFAFPCDVFSCRSRAAPASRDTGSGTAASAGGISSKADSDARATGAAASVLARQDTSTETFRAGIAARKRQGTSSAASRCRSNGCSRAAEQRR
jgi:hypothetical protein